MDKFYTAPDVAKECIERLKPYIDGLLLIEPSAGNGSFSKQISCTAYDIEPEDTTITKQDYLKTNPPSVHYAVFGNPPFGDRNNLAKAFIRHSLNADIIAFVLPRVFEKATYQRVFPKNWSLIDQYVLPDNSFLLNNQRIHIPCVYQIWQRDSKLPNLRDPDLKLTETKDFSITNSKDADLFVFGAAPHKFLDPSEVLETNRGYYLKIKTDINQVKTNLSSIEWKKYGKSSVNGGVFWLTKTEFIQAYEDGIL